MLISVVIPTYNRADVLRRAIDSVLSQNSPLEIWVIDGNSQDTTIAILKSYTDPRIHWISESDTGIYNAMNKGISLANGEWIYFLGSDDVLLPDVLERVTPFLKEENKIVFGNVQFDNGHTMKSFLGKRTIVQNTLHHQSAFYHKTLFDSFRYKEDKKVMSDYELNLIAYMQKMPTTYFSANIAFCSTGGASANWLTGWQETNAIRRCHISTLTNLACSFILGFYYLQKQIRTSLYGHRV